MSLEVLYTRLMKAGNLPRAKQPVIEVLMLEDECGNLQGQVVNVRGTEH